MPTYDYKCDACGHAFEVFQSMKADPVRKCPACKKQKVKRLIGTGAGLIFKGSGFYITDYRDQSYKDKAKADSGSGASGNGDAAKSDASSGTAGESSKPTTPAADAKPAAESKATAPAPAKSESKSSSSKKKDK